MLRTQFITKIHLVISICIVVPVAIIYGFIPQILFDINLNTVDEHNVYKAIMGLYLGFAVLWILGICNIKFLRVALISNTIFMLGLGFGRLISLVLDGTPTLFYVFGTIGELVLGFYGFWVLQRKKQ
ncbi:DUF4345 domain-containing protein [Seonamhaeicola aphaedonensis]|uniref:Uncharacterized protein DUF4345 n=1 Tax=Seonamhaeicola aphaedonensis TaxID=1461338 RepID=A0A3D9HMU0_9FLAO|nr:DUF4345 domain-containing protein [Seonamhaeicola aphaedonensis]RED50715.1 uncharacterized protein DUF4345 [Seonamhaeicola aphaedonensis]